ncbi:MAG: DUF4184 family protein [Bacteroidia bacterium]
MGFTFSHPALILPFKYLPRKYYSLSGLIMGSMAPDFEYFLRWDNQSVLSHTFKGVFLFDIPFSIIALIIFHEIMRNILISNAPSFIKERLTFLLEMNWFDYFKKNALLVLCSIFIGVCTHLFWDNYTALNGYFVRKNTFLTTQHFFFGIELFNYKILKHLSSIVGGGILIYLFLKLPRKKILLLPKKYFWLLTFIIFLACIFFYIGVSGNFILSFNQLTKKSISYMLFSLVVTTIYFKRKETTLAD